MSEPTPEEIDRYYKTHKQRLVHDLDHTELRDELRRNGSRLDERAKTLDRLTRELEHGDEFVRRWLERRPQVLAETERNRERYHTLQVRAAALERAKLEHDRHLQLERMKQKVAEMERELERDEARGGPAKSVERQVNWTPPHLDQYGR